MLVALLARYGLASKGAGVLRSFQHAQTRHAQSDGESARQKGDAKRDRRVAGLIGAREPHATKWVDDDSDIADDEEIEGAQGLKELEAQAGIDGEADRAELKRAPAGASVGQGGSGSAPVRGVPTPADEEQEELEDNGVRGGSAAAQSNLLSALQQASQPEGASDRIFGGRASSGGASPAAQVGAVPAEISPSPTPIPTLTWMQGQARGYTMLYAAQPQARAVVEEQVAALLEARIREPYVGILIDGTFGRDDAYLQSIIQRLSADGRQLVLALYLANGPTMRDYHVTSIDTPFSRIEPGSFRARIVEEFQLQESYAEVAVQARELFRFSQGVNPANKNIAVVMLEDNLNRSSYGVMREIARSALDGSNFTIVRNPCVGCFRGNDGDSLGDASEEHQMSRFSLLMQGDGFSLDGTGFSYPEAAEQEGLSSAAVLQLMRDSVQRRLRYVGLWRAAWQGVVPGVDNLHPSQRSYRASNAAQRAFEIAVLREGLTEESR